MHTAIVSLRPFHLMHGCDPHLPTDVSSGTPHNLEVDVHQYGLSLTQHIKDTYTTACLAQDKLDVSHKRCYDATHRTFILTKVAWSFSICLPVNKVVCLSSHRLTGGSAVSFAGCLTSCTKYLIWKPVLSPLLMYNAFSRTYPLHL